MVEGCTVWLHAVGPRLSVHARLAGRLHRKQTHSARAGTNDEILDHSWCAGVLDDLDFVNLVALAIELRLSLIHI